MNDGMSWYSHWARDYENPPEDRWGDDEDYEEEDYEDEERHGLLADWA